MRVLSGSLDHERDICGAQATESNAENRVSLFGCFIDLQTGCDTANHTLLWQLLTRYGVPL